jgi:5,10-methylenetetrahydromethanopterin reductase
LGLNLYDDYYSRNNWFRAEEIVRAARLADERAFHSIWLNEDIGRDSFVMLGNLADQTDRIGLATGIVNVYTRSPIQIAMAIATLDELSNGRAILGLGTGHERSVLAGHGMSLEDPLERMREYVNIIRKMLSGEHFSYSGKFTQIRSTRLNIRGRGAHKVSIYLAARTEKTVCLAGEIANGVLLNMPSVKWIKEEVLPSMKKGLLLAGRREEEATVAAIIHCFLFKDRKRGCQAARRSITAFVKSKAFVRMVSQMGYSDEIRRVRDEVMRGNVGEASKHIPDKLAQELVPFGTVSEVVSRIQNFVNNGVKLPIVSFRPQFGEGIKLVEEAIRMLSTETALD